jgi:chlorobactene glucosyltransferase
VSDLASALLAASPWIAAVLFAAWRSRDSRSLDEWPAAPPNDAPRVSVIIPARNEARNIARCVTSILRARYPALEVIVVDDHSSDDTGDIARRIAAADDRVTVIQPPPLPADWFGKQWACWAGAAAAAGSILLFTDADTEHGVDLVARGVNCMHDTRAELLSIVGSQELGSFWERLVQPQVFAVMAFRYGGTEHVNRSRRVSDKIANGQCIFMQRALYDAIGGHEAVKGRVAEDLALAQLAFTRGARTRLAFGKGQLATRMYTSLGEIVQGWRKNLFVAGQATVPLGRIGQGLYPFLFPLPPLFTVAPVIMLALGLAGVGPEWLTLGGAIAVGVALLWWLVVYREMEAPLGYAFLFPVGALVLLAILLQSVTRGARVSWKGRDYLAR